MARFTFSDDLGGAQAVLLGFKVPVSCLEPHTFPARSVDHLQLPLGVLYGGPEEALVGRQTQLHAEVLGDPEERADLWTVLWFVFDLDGVDIESHVDGGEVFHDATFAPAQGPPAADDADVLDFTDLGVALLAQALGVQDLHKLIFHLLLLRDVQVLAVAREVAGVGFRSKSREELL